MSEMKKTYSQLSQVELKLESLSKKDALEIMPKTQEILERSQKLYAKIEKVNFFESDSVKDIFEKNLDKIYSIDFKVRKVAFEDTTSSGADSELLESASILSMNLLRNLDASKV